MRVFFFYIQGSVFWCAKFKSEVHFPRPWQENLENSEENRFFSRLLKISDMAAGFLWGRLRWDSLSAFGASLRPTLLAIGAIAPPKASLWSRINTTLFTAGGNNTQELISNWTAEVWFFFKFNSEILDNPEIHIFPDCRGFSVPADRNRRQIWILQVKIHYLK